MFLDSFVSHLIILDVCRYLTTNQILEKKLTNPDATLKSAVAGFKTGDWMRTFEALNNVRSVALHAPSTMGGNLHSVVLSVLKAADNLRSSVSKNAIITLKDMFIGCKK